MNTKEQELLKKLYTEVGVLLELESNQANIKMGYGKAHIEKAKAYIKHTHQCLKELYTPEQKEMF